MLPPLDALALALGAGALAAVNPCGFALLPAYLSIFVLDQHGSRATAVGRALRATGAMTIGFTGVFAIFGLVVAPITSAVQNYLPGFTVILGLLLVVAGIWTVTGRSLPAPQLPTGGNRAITAGIGSMIGFGASYAIASLGCTIAPFLAVVVTSFRGGSVLSGLLLFLAYAAGMGVLVGVAAVATAIARGGVVRTARRFAQLLPRIAGGLLIVAGGYVAWYGFWELRVIFAGSGTDPIVDAASALQRTLADAVDSIGIGWLVITLILFLGAGALIGRLGRSRK